MREWGYFSDIFTVKLEKKDHQWICLWVFLQTGALSQQVEFNVFFNLRKLWVKLYKRVVSLNMGPHSLV